MPNCSLSRLFWKNCGFNILFNFSAVPKKMWLKKHKADHISPDKKGQDWSKSTQKSSQALSKSAQGLSKSAQGLSKSAQGSSKSEERGEPFFENCKVLVQNQNPFVLPADSWALAAYYAENTSLPRALVGKSPKEQKSPLDQTKSGKIRFCWFATSRFIFKFQFREFPAISWFDFFRYLQKKICELLTLEISSGRSGSH